MKQAQIAIAMADMAQNDNVPITVSHGMSLRSAAVSMQHKATAASDGTRERLTYRPTSNTVNFVIRYIWNTVVMNVNAIMTMTLQYIGAPILYKMKIIGRMERLMTEYPT